MPSIQVGAFSVRCKLCVRGSGGRGGRKSFALYIRQDFSHEYTNMLPCF